MQAVELFAVWVFASGYGFLQGVLFCHGVGVSREVQAVELFAVWGFPGKCKPFILSRCFFLQAVFVPGGAVCFVVGWGFPGGSCTQLCLLCWAVCVSASRLFCRGVFFCTRYWFLACRFVLSLCALHGFFLRKLVGLGCCLLSIFIFKTQSFASNARIACKTIKSTQSHGI